MCHVVVSMSTPHMNNIWLEICLCSKFYTSSFFIFISCSFIRKILFSFDTKLKEDIILKSVIAKENPKIKSTQIFSHTTILECYDTLFGRRKTYEFDVKEDHDLVPYIFHYCPILFSTLYPTDKRCK